MTSADFEHEVPVSQYGAQRRAEWLARLHTNHDMAERAALEAHGQSEDHRVVQAGQAGLYGHATPQDMGAAFAACTATIGAAWSNERPLERHGGEFSHHVVAPAPARADLRFVNQSAGQPAAESPLARWLRENR